MLHDADVRQAAFADLAQQRAHAGLVHFHADEVEIRPRGSDGGRGLAHAELGNAKEAVRDLETYLAHAEDGLDADMVAERLNALRRSLG